MKKFRILMALILFLCVFTLTAGKPAKYVFLLIGDGMGEGTVQLYTKLFPNSNFSKFGNFIPTGTNNVRGKTTDSAASGTALACGIKTYNGAIGVDKNGTPRSSLARLLQKRDWKIGIISSVSINDATPGTHYANRLTRKDHSGILADLFASHYDFFGISQYFSPKDFQKSDLDKLLRRNGYTIVDGKKLNTLKPGDRNIVISDTHATAVKAKLPRLADVTAKAAELLSANGNSFFLMVEGGAIDHCNHRNDAVYSMQEMAEFDAVIGSALKFAEKHPDETLIVVTADHETGGLMIKDLNLANKSFLNAQNITNVAISSKMEKLKKAKATTAQLTEAVCKELGLTKLTSDESKRLEQACQLFVSGKKTKGDKLARSMGYGRYNPLVIEALRIRDSRNGFIYTSFSHTPTKVRTYVRGAGAENFKAPQENSDIPHRIAAAAGFPGLLEKEGANPPFPVRKNITGFIDLYRVTTTSATLHYGFNTAAKREFKINGKVVKTVNDFFGKATFENLKPDTEYTVSCGKYQRKFRTQKLIPGKPLFKVGVMSDVHLTTQPDIPPRMHSRSGVLATEMVKRFNKQKVDFLFFPGDLTDKALPGDLELAVKVLKTAKMKTLFTHGNHDRVNDRNRKFWKKNFNAPTGIFVHKGIQIAWLNTCIGWFNTPENAAVINKIDEKLPLILFTHYQIFPDKYINVRDRASVVAEMRKKASIADAPAAARPLLEKISRCKAVILVGHKNVASAVKVGNAIQFNMPQLTEYPAGALAMEVYSCGVRFTFEPIADAFAEEYTRRRVTENSLLGFRTRHSVPVWNQSFPWGGSDKMVFPVWKNK